MQESEYSLVQITADSEKPPQQMISCVSSWWRSWKPVLISSPSICHPALSPSPRDLRPRGSQTWISLKRWDSRLRGTDDWRPYVRFGVQSPCNHGSLCPGKKHRKHEYATPLIAFPESPFLTVNWNTMMLDLKSFLVYISLGENLQWVTVIQWVTAQPWPSLTFSKWSIITKQPYTWTHIVNSKVYVELFDVRDDTPLWKYNLAGLKLGGHSPETGHSL